MPDQANNINTQHIKHGEFFGPIDTTLEEERKKNLEAWKSIAKYSNMRSLNKLSDIAFWVGQTMQVKEKETNRNVTLKITAVDKETGKIEFNSESRLTADEFNNNYAFEKMGNTSEPAE